MKSNGFQKYLQSVLDNKNNLIEVDNLVCRRMYPKRGKNIVD